MSTSSVSGTAAAPGTVAAARDLAASGGSERHVLVALGLDGGWFADKVLNVCATRWVAFRYTRRVSPGLL